MGDTRINNYTKVRDLVSQGITSPSIILSKIPEIKNWRTARKYIKEATEELLDTFDVISREAEYLAMVESLRGLKSDLITKMGGEKSLNQYLGILKYVMKTNEQLVKLTNLHKVSIGSKRSREFDLRLEQM